MQMIVCATFLRAPEYWNTTSSLTLEQKITDLLKYVSGLCSPQCSSRYRRYRCSCAIHLPNAILTIGHLPCMHSHMWLLLSCDTYPEPLCLHIARTLPVR